jgi:hypothetical protein
MEILDRPAVPAVERQALNGVPSFPKTKGQVLPIGT